MILAPQRLNPFSNLLVEWALNGFDFDVSDIKEYGKILKYAKICMKTKKTNENGIFCEKYVECHSFEKIDINHKYD